MLLSACVQEMGSEAKFIAGPHRGGPAESYRRLYTVDIYRPTWQIAYGYASCTANELAEKKRQQRELLDAVRRVARLWLQPVYDLYLDYPQTPLVKKFNFVERQAVEENPAYFEHHHSLQTDGQPYQMQVIFYCEKDFSYAAIGRQEFHLFEAPYRSIPEKIADTGYDVLALAHEMGHLFGIAHTYIRTELQTIGDYRRSSGGLRQTFGTNPASVMSLFYLMGSNDKLKLTRDDYLAVQWTHDYHHDGTHRYYPKTNLVKDPKDCRFPDLKYEEVLDDNGERSSHGCVPKYPLHFELKQGHLQIAQRIVAEDPNLNLDLQHPDTGMTAMHYAVLLNGVGLVSSLLLKGAKVDLVTSDDQSTVLHYSALFGRQRITELFLTHPEIKVNAKNSKGNSPLHLATMIGDVDIVNALIKLPNIEINSVNNDGNSPLHLAASLGKNEVVVALLNGATEVITTLDAQRTAKLRINLRSEDNSTALHYAARNGHLEVARSLIAQPTMQVNAIDIHKRTALIYAVINEHVDVVRELLTRDDLDISVYDRSGASALGIASHRNTQKSKQIVELLEGR